MNTAIHIIEQLKCNQLMLKIILILTLMKKLMINILNVVGDHVKYQNTKKYLLKAILQIGLNKFL